MTKYLFFALPISIALGVATKITLIPSVNIYLWDLVSFAIILISVKKIFLFFKKKNIFVYLFLLFSAVSILGLLLSNLGFLEFIASASYLLRISMYLVLIIPLLSLDKNTVWRLKKIMLFSGFLFVFLGYIQYFYYPNLRNLYYLGWDEHLYRLFSTFLDPNFAGIFIVLIIICFSVFTFGKLQKRHSSQKLIFVAGYLFLIPSLFLTYSRSSMISGLISFLFFLFLLGKKKAATLIIGLFIVSIFFLPKNLGGEGVNLLRTYSANARLAQYSYALEIFKENPIVGVGFNSLRFTSARHGFLQQFDSHAAAGFPNSFLVILATTGVLGFALFVVYLINTMKYIRTLKNNLYSTALTSMFIAVMVDSLFENALLFAPVMLWMILSVGVLREKFKGST